MPHKILSRIFLILLSVQLSSSAIAQEPVRQYKFTMHKTGLYAGECSVSPSGKLLLATFNDMGKSSVYELVDLTTGRLIGTGNLDAVPNKISWSADSKYMMIEFSRINPVFYNMSNGLKKMFSFSRGGSPVFRPQLGFGIKAADPDIYVFDEQVSYHYNIQGKLLDSTEYDDYHSVDGAWFNQLQRNFVVMNSDGFDTYSLQGKYTSSKAITGLDIYKSNFTDQDGGSLVLYDRSGFARYDAVTGKIIQELHGDEEMQAVCLTPDKKNVLYKSSGKLTLLNEKKVKTTITLKDYYSKLFYTGFGTELVGVNPDEVKIYACKNYLPVATAAPVVKPTPAPPVVVKNPPPVVKPTPVPVKPKWNQPYTVVDFITPKEKDSFYLYSTDRGFKYLVKYYKIEGNILWPNPYRYFQYFGLGAEQKYQSYYLYLLDNADGEARIGTYAYSSAYETKEQMVGGQNFLAKIPEKGQTITWRNKLYTDEYTLSAQVVDMVYKGKMKKFLAVSRGGSLNGQPIDEASYYQLGVGLTFIKSNGKIVFERSF